MLAVERYCIIVFLNENKIALKFVIFVFEI